MAAGPTGNFMTRTQLYTGAHYLIVNPNAADVDIIGLDETPVASGGNGTTPGQGRMCRWLMPMTVGTLVVTRGDGIDVTIVMPAGFSDQVFALQAKGLESTGSSVTAVLVIW